MSYVTANVGKMIKFDVIENSKMKTYERFKQVFVAHANARGYGEIVGGDTPVPEKANATTDPLKEIYKLNMMGYSDLILSVMDNYEAFEHGLPRQ